MNNISDTKNRRILVIDDNPAIHDDFRKILAASTVSTTELDATESAVFGGSVDPVHQTTFEITSAFQGQEGVELAAAAIAAGRPYAMAFVDVRMPPGWDGVETTAKLWELDPGLQVVLCTAYSDYSWNEMFKVLGQRDGLLILKKPFDSVEAFQLAHALTEKWWLYQESQQKMEELERRVAERARELADSVSLLTATLESTADAIVAIDLSGKVIIYNARFAEMWDFPAGMLERRNAAELRAHSAAQMKDPAAFLNRVAESDNQPETEEFHEVELKDGRIFERHAFPQWIGGKCVGRVFNWRDITERRTSEIALLESNKKFHLLADNISDAFWIRSEDMREDHYFSPAFEKIWRRPLASLYADPQRWSEFVYPEDREAVLAAFVALREGAGQLDIEYRIIRSDGEIRWVHARGFKVSEDNNRVVRNIGIISDITESKRMKTRLFQSQKMETIGKLTGGIAHEFNSILTAIIGQSELLLNDVPPDSSAARSAGEISKAAGRAAALTRQLLAYGRKQILKPEVLDLNQVISRLDGVFRHLMGNDVDVQIISEPRLKSTKVDAGQIEQVLINMVMNAREAMPNGGKLTIETANIIAGPDSGIRYPELAPGAYVRVAITDTGFGMDRDVLTRIFEPFYTTKSQGEGAGLGLSTCQGIIKQSGGHINVYSERGRGTTFKIYLPQVETSPAAAAPRQDMPELPRGTETILFVEDDPALREMAATLLRRLGYTVLAAANGIEALSVKQTPGVGHIDLLFTDVVMPHMSGKELADRVRALFPHTKILFTSAFTENAIVHQGILDKGVPLLQKPFTPSEMARKLREILDNTGAD